MTDEIVGLLDGTDRRANWGEHSAKVLAERYMAGHGIAVSGKIGVEADLERLVGLDGQQCFRTFMP